MTQVVIEDVLWDGWKGTVFNATAVDTGKRHRVVASRLVMPREPVPGEVWELSGVVRKHPRHGQQVEAEKALLLRPSGRLVIGAISKSPLFPGIGPKKAERLWDAFDEKLYELLDMGDPVPFIGILGDELAQGLVDGWGEMGIDASVYSWLDRHGVSPSLARSVATIYGREAIDKLDENPYRLLAFSSWNRVDAMARSMGVRSDDRRRQVAAADAVVYQRLDGRHTVTDERHFSGLLRQRLGTDEEGAQDALCAALMEHAVVRVGQTLQGLGPASMERFIAQRVIDMADGRFEAEQIMLRAPIDIDRIADEFGRREALVLNAEQRAAMRMAATQAVCCITGGAGTGKTTLLRAVYSAIELSGGTVVQCALAGRAALRMSEATLRPSVTIAKLLKLVDTGQLVLDRGKTVVIDEASMVDLALTYRILRRMQPGTRLILVGDAAQLPPINFGLCFHALVTCEKVPRVELREIMRAAAETGIPQASRLIRDGVVPDVAAYEGRGRGVSFVDAAPTEMADSILEVVNDLGGVAESQVIGAIKRGPGGTKTINGMFHELLTSGRPENSGFAEGEPVIQLENNYELGIMNGSLGTIVSAIDPDNLAIDFQGEQVIVPYQLWGALDHAYAITSHKAQGSQFGRVVIPLLPSRLLDRTLLYTSVTRAREQVVIVGDRGAFTKAVQELPSPSRRETAMACHLSEVSGGTIPA